MSISRALNMCLDTIEEFFRKDKRVKNKVDFRAHLYKGS